MGRGRNQIIIQRGRGGSGGEKDKYLKADGYILMTRLPGVTINIFKLRS